MTTANMRIDSQDPSQYCANYCEENIWRLGSRLAPRTAWVLIISNFQQGVAIWRQRSASRVPDPIVWDYHVVLAAASAGGWDCLDFDTRLPCPVPLDTYLSASFPAQDRVPRAYRPLFKCIPLPRYLREFGSDRSHMRASGAWLSPQPRWPAIGSHHTLPAMIDMRNRQHGQVFDLAQLRRFFLSHDEVA